MNVIDESNFDDLFITLKNHPEPKDVEPPWPGAQLGLE
jgi:hypothetical protein